MNILVRLDISNKIGTGHFRRMYNLSKYMTEHNFVFIIKTDNENNSIFNDIEAIFIAKSNEDVIIKKIILKKNIDILIFDLLHYENNYIKNIKELNRVKIVSFHEYDDISKYSDLSINYNFFNGYENIKDSKFLAGPKYIILNEDIDKTKNIYNNEEYIFVSFGGSDPSNLIEKFINNIANKLLDINFIIHIGNFKKLDNIIVGQNIELLDKPSNIFDYMFKAKLAISAAGNMMYELIYLNIPLLVIAHNEHQDEFAKNAAKYDCIEYIGLANSIDYNKLEIKILEEFKKDRDCKSIIDNNGKARISQAINGLIL